MHALIKGRGPTNQICYIHISASNRYFIYFPKAEATNYRLTNYKLKRLRSLLL